MTPPPRLGSTGPLIPVLLLLLALLQPASAREFTDLKGRKLEATFVGFKGKSAGLRLDTGKIVYVPISKLSPPDREFLKNHPLRKLPPIVIDPKSRYPVRNKDGDPYYIDLKGRKQFTPPKKNTAASAFQGKAALVDKGNAFIDQGGQVLLHTKNCEASTFWRCRWDDDLLAAKDDESDRFGFVDHKNGKFVIPARYTRVMPMRDGVAWVSADGGRGRGNDSVVWQLIDKQGAELATLPKGSSPRAFSDGYSLVSTYINLKRSFAYYDTNGKPAFQDKQLRGRAYPFEEGYAIVGNGLLDRHGNWAINPSEGWDLAPSSGRVMNGVLLGRKHQAKSRALSVILAENGGVLCNLPDEPYLDFRLAGDGLIAARRKENPKLWGCLDRLGNEVIAPQFIFAPVFTGGFGKVELPAEPKSINAVIDREGKELWRQPN